MRRLVALSAACSSLFGSPARAQEGKWGFGVGISLGYAFGSHPGFELGAELFGTYVFNTHFTCGPQPLRHGFGPMLQVAAIGWDTYAFTIGGHAGGEFEPNFAVRGELGATQRFGAAPGFGIHSGAMFSPFIFDVGWRSTWLLNQQALLGGVRVPPTYGVPQTAECIIGRPLRSDAELVNVAPRARRLGGSLQRRRRRDRAEPAGRRWERDAQYECASVPAFLQLAGELLAHGAPESLVARALDAASDEMRHAVLCADVASRYLGERVWPVLPRAKRRGPLAGPSGLTRLAVESWLDGCLGEGAAATRASFAATHAADRVAEAASHVIAADEHRHAELAWSILGWAVDRGGEAARANVRAVRDVTVPAEADTEVDLERFGGLRARELRDLGEVHAAKCRRRLDALV